MKRVKLVFCLVIGMMAIMAAGTVSVSANDYTIDGCMKDDWDVNLSDDWNSIKTWAPASPTCNWIVEDNIDPQYYSSWNYHGIHATGKGRWYSYYLEPKIIIQKKGKLSASHKQPFHERGWSARARERNDIEGMYLDNNKTHTFVAIVTSIPPDTVMGDLAIDADGNNSKYEYGIVLNGEDRGRIYQNTSWSETDKFKNSGPYRITGGTFIGTANIAYEDQRIFDFGKTNWVIEISMPKLNITKLHATLLCGNDVVEVIPTKPTPSPEPTIIPEPTLSPTPTIIPSPIPTLTPAPTPPKEEIPEFATIAIPIAAILGLFFFFNRKKQRNT